MIWMDVDAVLTEVPVNSVPLTSDSDFKTVDETIAYNESGMTLFWHFERTDGIKTVTAVTPTTGGGDYDWAHQAQGIYSIGLPDTGGASVDNNIEGFGYFTGEADAVLPWRGPTIGFRAAPLNALLIDTAFSATRGLSGTALPAVAAKAVGGLYTRGSGAGQINQTANGSIDANAVSAIAAFVLDMMTVDSGTTSRVSAVSGSMILETAKAIWDRITNGANHNISGSAGRILRTLQTLGTYDNSSLWFDSVDGVGGTDQYENATGGNPSNSLANMLTIMGTSGTKYKAITVVPGSTLTLNATVATKALLGEHWTLVLGGQSISGTFVSGADVSGICTGPAEVHFFNCHMSSVTVPEAHIESCGLAGVLTLSAAGNYFLDGCHSSGSPAVDFQDANENKNVCISGYQGKLELRNFGQAGATHTVDIVGGGELILASTCEIGTINISGNIKLTDNVVGGFVSGGGTINQNARVTHLRIAALHSTTNTLIGTKHTATDAKIDATDGLVNGLTDVTAAQVVTAMEGAGTILKALETLTKAGGPGDLAAALLRTLDIRSITNGETVMDIDEDGGTVVYKNVNGSTRFTHTITKTARTSA